MTASITDALVEAFASGDPAVLGARMAPGALLWHNSDKVEGDAVDGFGARSPWCRRLRNNVIQRLVRSGHC